MKSKTRVLPIVLSLIVTVGASALGAPNILLILADDIGADVCDVADTSMNVKTAEEDIALPTLSELAAGGVRFTRAYSEPACTPTRASIYTGLHPYHSGAPHPNKHNLPLSKATFADLAPDTYYCGLFGKWHLGDNVGSDGSDGSAATSAINNDFEGVQPQWHGWDSWAGHVDSQPSPNYSKWTYWALNAETPPVYDDTDIDTTDSNFGLDWYPDQVHVNNIKLAISAAKAANQPFCITFATSLAHDPLHNPAAPETKTDSADFGDMVLSLDDKIDQLLDHLQDEGLLANTVIIFVGDNGTPHTVNLNYGPDGIVGGAIDPVTEKNDDVTGAKTDLTDAGLRVPLIIAEGRCVRSAATTGTWVTPTKGTASEEFVAVIDLFGTICDLMGVTDAGVTDSQSLQPFLAGTGNLTRNHVFAQWGVSAATSESTWLVEGIGGVIYRLNHDASDATTPWTAFLNEESIALTDIPSGARNRFITTMGLYQPVSTDQDDGGAGSFVSPF